MTFAMILAALKSIADMIKGWFGWQASKEKEKKDAVDKTTSGIGKGKPFVWLVVGLLFMSGCYGYVYTISVPMTFDAMDFQYLQEGESFEVPKPGYYFSYDGLETYIRSKIAEYEIRKKGFFHREENEK